MTSSEGLVVVNRLADDPQSKELAFERIVSPGKTARLYGSNLQNVTAILLGGNTITDPTYVESADENYLEYIVPTGVSEGDYRIVLQDAAGWGNVSVENNHIDVFIFEFADVLRWLSKEYNEPRFSDFAEVISTSMCQLLPYKGHMCGVIKVGYYPEVIQHTNWDYGRNGKGYRCQAQ